MQPLKIVVAVYFLVVTGSVDALEPNCAVNAQEMFREPQKLEVHWSKPVNGLSLGIQVIKKHFIFVPREDWSGQYILIEKDEKSGITSMTSNPGGAWEGNPSIDVFLRNSSTNTIFWARDRDRQHHFLG